MKTLLTLLGIAASCLLSGCAHDTSTKAASKSGAETSANPSINLAVTNTGNPPLAYQWRTNIGGATVVTNR
jgi:uncharacterized lipoprotein YajG